MAAVLKDGGGPAEGRVESIEEIGPALAAALREGWRFVRHSDLRREVESTVAARWGYLHRLSDGAALHLKLEIAEQRVSVCGLLPHLEDDKPPLEISSGLRGRYTDSATMSLARGPARVARDIQLRVLKPYLPMYAQEVQKRRRYDESAIARVLLAADLGRALGTQPRERDPTNTEMAIYAFLGSMHPLDGDAYKSEASVDVRLRRYGHEVKLSGLTDDEVRAVVDMARGFKAARTAAGPSKETGR